MLYGEILSKFVLYVYILSKQQKASPNLENELYRVIECVQSLLRQIEHELIVNNSTPTSSGSSIIDDIEKVWDDTYNYVFPMLVLNQLSSPLMDVTA